MLAELARPGAILLARRAQNALSGVWPAITQTKIPSQCETLLFCTAESHIDRLLIVFTSDLRPGARKS